MGYNDQGVSGGGGGGVAGALGFGGASSPSQYARRSRQ